MAVLSLKSGGDGIHIDGEGFVDISPGTDPRGLAAELRKLPRGHALSLPELFPMLTQASKDVIQEVGNTPEFRDWFGVLTTRFATLGAVNGKSWTRKEIEPAWCRLIKTWLVDEVIKARSGVIFVRLTSGEILSNDEFAIMAGKGIEEHLDEFVESTTYAVAEIKAILHAPLITREVSAVNRDGAIETLTLTGPDVISVDQWAHPPGYTLLDSESCT